MVHVHAQRVVQIKRNRRTVDALALRADEGRGVTAISRGEPSNRLIRGFPNEATRRRLYAVTPD